MNSQNNIGVDANRRNIDYTMNRMTGMLPYQVPRANNIKCLTMYTDYSRARTFCTNGNSCGAKCINTIRNGVCTNGDNDYCLVNVVFQNNLQKRYVGHYTPCRNHLLGVIPQSL